MITSNQNKIGVFICHCGDNISGKLNIKLLKDFLMKTGLSCVEDHPYLCSVEGQQLIADKIKSEKLKGIVIAACSPEIHQQKFRDFAEFAGINRYMVDISNIREQCAWFSKDDDPTTRALDIIRSSVSAMQIAKPLDKLVFPVVKSAVVIGGGISGITAALSLARQNIKVHLIEKSPTIGGNMVKIGKVYSGETMSEECAMCSLAPTMGEVMENPNIEVLTMSSVDSITGHAGNFDVKVLSGPLMVDRELCMACGECSDICSVSVNNEWDANLSSRKAIYKPFPQAIPRSYTVDSNACIKCGACVEKCVSGAINLNNKVIKRIINVGAIIIATGHHELDPEDKEEFGYNRYPGVITQMELARILAVNGPTSGKLITPSSGNKPRRIVMVQCVGSRDRKPGSVPYCSTICCMVALKHTNYIINHFKDVEIFICYTDMRTPGTYENYYFETQKKGEKNVRFIRGKVAEVKQDRDNLVVRVEDTLSEGLIEIEADMVVLSCAIVPSYDADKLETSLGVSLTEEKFVQEKHSKLEPTQTTVPGIFVCGTAQKAMDITDSINIARSSASKVTELLNSGKIGIEPKYAVIDGEICDECGECLDICLNGAIHKKNTIKIDPIICSGDGKCISKCRKGAISLLGCGDDELFARIKGILSSETPAIVAFLDEKIAYITADNMGVNRVKYPPEVRIIRIPSIMRLDIKHIIYAFNHGATGIFLSDGNDLGNPGNEIIYGKVEELKKQADLAGLDPRRIWFYRAYLPHYKGLAKQLEEFSNLIKDINKKSS